jgi:hypothetical protein
MTDQELLEAFRDVCAQCKIDFNQDDGEIAWNTEVFAAFGTARGEYGKLAIYDATRAVVQQR